MKKLFSLVLALVMMLALATTSFATATTDTTSVTITSANNPNASYEGYRLMGLTTALKCSDSHDHTESCYIYSYKVNSKYIEILKAELGITVAATGKTIDQTIMDAIAAKANAADIRLFAEHILDAIETKGLEKDKSLTEGDPATLTQGYWLIVDVTPAANVEAGVIRSLVMLDTAGKPVLKINAKDDKELLEKTVNDSNVNIGQTVTYTLNYTLPSNLDEYLAYTFQIKDTLSEGLDFTGTCTIKIGETTVTAVAPVFTGRVMSIDLGKHILDNKVAYVGKEVVITYTATVNDAAIIAGAGNPNAAELTYSNDPSKTSTGKLEDNVVVSTYAIAIQKVNTAGEALAGAEFLLPFFVKADPTAENTYIYAGTSSADTSLTNKVTTPEDGVIIIKGVEANTYEITETKAPEGYNKLAAPVVVTAQPLTTETTTTTTYLDADGNVTTQDKAVVTVEYVNDNLAVTSVVVVNKTGSELPSTGGVGTTIFYTVGGVMMAAAFVLFITKKKMANEQ